MADLLPPGIEDELRSDEPLSPELRQLMRKARDASDFLKALAHESRLLLLCLIAQRERSVTELEEILSLRQANVSQQLAKLRAEGLVGARRDGKSVHYYVADPAAQRVLALLYDIYCAPADENEMQSPAPGIGAKQT